MVMIIVSEISSKKQHNSRAQYLRDACPYSLKLIC